MFSIKFAALFVSKGGNFIMAKRSVAGICIKDGKVFIAKRINKGQMANRWEFPGGKADNDEDNKTALKREFEEEFAIQIEVGDCIAKEFFFHNGNKIELYAYSVDFSIPHDGKFTLSEHTETDWVSFDKIEMLDFVDSDLKILAQIKKYYGFLDKKNDEV